jgi:hypothetical protein
MDTPLEDEQATRVLHKCSVRTHGGQVEHIDVIKAWSNHGALTLEFANGTHALFAPGQWLQCKPVG